MSSFFTVFGILSIIAGSSHLMYSSFKSFTYRKLSLVSSRLPALAFFQSSSPIAAYPLFLLIEGEYCRVSASITIIYNSVLFAVIVSRMFFVYAQVSYTQLIAKYENDRKDSKALLFFSLIVKRQRSIGVSAFLLLFSVHIVPQIVYLQKVLSGAEEHCDEIVGPAYEYLGYCMLFDAAALVVIVYELRSVNESLFLKRDFGFVLLLIVANIPILGIISVLPASDRSKQIIQTIWQFIGGELMTYYSMTRAVLLVKRFGLSENVKGNLIPNRLLELLGEGDNLHKKPSRATSFDGRNAELLSLSSKFMAVLENKEALEAFTSFLKKEFAVENILYWNRVIEWRANMVANTKKDSAKRDALLREAQEIYDSFIDESSLYCINISADCRNTLKAYFKSDKSTSVLESSEKDVTFIFDTAIKEIFAMLLFDSFRRFNRTEVCKDFLGKYEEQVKSMNE